MKQQSYKSYQRYKPSGVEWLGDIPEHWEVKKLKYLGKCQNGVSAGSEYFGSGHPFVNYTDIYRNEALPIEVTGLANSSHSDRITYSVEIGDVFFTRTSETIEEIGFASTCLTAIKNAIFSGFLIRFRPIPHKLTSGFSKYYFRCRLLRFFFVKEMNLVTRASLSQDLLKSLTVLIPSLPEQDSIASFLDDKTKQIDSLIEKKQKLIELLKEERQAVINEAVTKGINPNAKMKLSGVDWLGDIPEHWEVKKLSYLSDRIGDGLHGTPEYVDDSEIYFINGNNLVNGSISITDNTGMISEIEYDKYRIDLTPSTILLSINGTIGNVAFYRGEKVALGKSAAYINCTDQLLPNFLYYFLLSNSLTTYFTLQLSGTTIYNLSLKSIRNTPTPIMSLKEQAEICLFLDDKTKQIDGICERAENEIELLQEYRTALITEVVTGKLDIR